MDVLHIKQLDELFQILNLFEKDLNLKGLEPHWNNITLPKAEGRFILYSDTSIEGTGSSLWQIQEGKPRLIGYASKTLPEACSRYSVTELEMTGLLVNMNWWKNLLKHREFDAAVDHVL